MWFFVLYVIIIFILYYIIRRQWSSGVKSYASVANIGPADFWPKIVSGHPRPGHSLHWLLALGALTTCKTSRFWAMGSRITRKTMWCWNPGTEKTNTHSRFWSHGIPDNTLKTKGCEPQEPIIKAHQNIRERFPIWLVIIIYIQIYKIMVCAIIFILFDN